MRAISKAKEAALLLFSVAGLLAGGAAVRGQSALDGFDPNANGPIRVVVVQPDGKILIGGAFTALSPNGGVEVTRSHIARLNPDGTLDTAFNPDVNQFGSNVFAIAVQADGKILVGGAFFSIGGQPRNNIARLDATTGLADSFNPNANDAVYAIAVQADGKILVGGSFNGANSIGGQTRNRIARLDATTGLADSFDPNANQDVNAIVVQADGKILASGLFSGANSIGGETRNRIARLDATAGLADSFDPNANDGVLSIAVQADGRILAGGNFTTIGGQTRNRIARLDATAGLADSFDPNANDRVNAIAVQADGKVLASGLFSGANSIGGQTRNRIARLDATTGLADSFDPNANDIIVWAIAVQADGKILAGGNFTTLAPNGGAALTRNHIARLETDGRLDQTLNLSTVGRYVSAIAVQPDGKILIGGNFTRVLGVARNSIARLHTDGTLDTAFDPNANSYVLSIAVQADGKILAGGFFNGENSIGGQPRNYIARLDPTTGLADSFDPNPDNHVFSIAVQADGKILAGGEFTTIGGQPRQRIARLDPTTGLADSFDPSANSYVFSIAVQADGKILAGGFFNGENSIGGQTRNGIARLDPTTGLADSFDPNASNTVESIAVQPDGKILACGRFTEIGGQTRNGIARLDPTTGLADSFDPNANSNVFSIAVQADGKILAGGDFSSIGGQPRNGIARLNATTGLADSFDPNASGEVDAVAVQADGKILAGGFFGNIGGQSRSLFARLTNDTAALQNLAVTQNTITWTRGGSSPQITRATFEYSNDNVNYTPLGSGTAAGSKWTLTGLSLPTGQNFYIRARGYYGSGSITESVRNAFVAPDPFPTTLGNISTRLRVETGDNVLIGGFIITGTQSKKVMVRGIGSSLTFADRLANPVLELRDSSGTLVDSNDNWGDSPHKQAIIDSTIAPTNDLESAIIATLPANGASYTAIVRGVNDGTGIGVVEAYDLDRSVDSKLANISTRGFVQTGDNVLIAGTIVVGATSQKVLVRAIAPSLDVPGKMADPTLELRDGNGALIDANDNWQDSPNKQAIIDTTIPPTNDLESAIVATLPANNASSTAIVRGVNNATGIAVVEMYALN